MWQISPIMVLIISFMEYHTELCFGLGVSFYWCCLGFSLQRREDLNRATPFH